MKTFSDRRGRTWEVELNVAQMKRVRSTLGVDLVNVIAVNSDGTLKTTLIDDIVNDPCLLVDILWVVCEKQAKAAGITDEDFGSALAGDAIEDATRAFLDELVDFFPGARRLFLKKAVDLARKFAGKMAETLKEALESPELEAMVLKAESQPAAASQESAASTPTPSP